MGQRHLNVLMWMGEVLGLVGDAIERKRQGNEMEWLAYGRVTRAYRDDDDMTRLLSNAVMIPHVLSVISLMS